jgi:hypothetical protein
MLVRPQKDYQVPLLEPVERALTDMLSALAHDDDAKAMLAIHHLFLTIWASNWEPSKENTMPCITQRCLALLSMQTNGSVCEPKGSTSHMSRFEHVMRLTFLKEIHLLAREKYNGNFDLAREALQPWFTEKLRSPFNTLRGLKHRAFAILSRTPSFPRSIWTDRVNWTSLLYKGDPLSLDQIRNMFVDLENLTRYQWEHKVLMGLKLRVDYDRLADDLTNTEVGYSFLSDPRNKMFHKRDRLAFAILGDPRLRAHFTTPNTNGGVHWSKHALQEWLIDYSHLEGLQATRTEMLAGAPGRTTEIHCMNYCNTPTRTTRNLSVLDQYIAVTRMYTKTGSITGVDRLIPHGLDAFTADMMIQDLAIARPFAELAINICYPNNDKIQELYQYRLFVNHTKEFVGADLTHVMTGLSLDACEFAIGINAWRHIHANFTKKLCNRTTELLEESEEDTPSIIQYGHNSRTHKIYGRSHDASLGPADDVLLDFMDASTDWQVVAKVVPGEQMCHASHQDCCLDHRPHFRWKTYPIQ